MESLQELRGQLDEIDAQIVDLYQKRMDVCSKVGGYKVAAGLKVFDKQREKEKLASVTENVTNEFYKKGLTELYKQMMSMSRKLQYQLLTEHGAMGSLPFIGVDELDVEESRIVFQGTEGAYSQATMKISVCFEGAYESGSLYQLLSHFVYNDLNVIKIESRPIEGRNREYCFFVDFEGNMADDAVKNAICGLQEEAHSFKILENY